MHLVLAIENTAFSLCAFFSTQTEHSKQQMACAAIKCRAVPHSPWRSVFSVGWNFSYRDIKFLSSLLRSGFPFDLPASPSPDIKFRVAWCSHQTD